MAENSKIGWTDHTFNPWWGCVKVSEGCKNCYAERDSNRWGHDVFGADKERRFFGDKHWNKPLSWNRKAEKEGKRAKVFCGSMCDVFEDNTAMREEVFRLLELIKATPHLDWLLLTKRVYVMAEWVDFLDDPDAGTNFIEDYPNIWLGVTTENQEQANKRIPELLKIPAKVRFLSVEPMLGMVDLQQAGAISRYISGGGGHGLPLSDGLESEGIHWVICGGESGNNARPINPYWVRWLRDQCKEANIPFFMKQMSGATKSERENIPEDLQIEQFPRTEETR